MKSRFVIVLMLMAALAAPARGQNRTVTLNIYNDGFSQVTEIRSVELERGLVNIKLYDIAPKIDPGSISLTGDNFEIRTVNYRYDLLSGDRLLNRYIGQRLEFTVDDSLYNAILLNFDDKYLYVAMHEANGPVSIYKREDLKPITLATAPIELISRPMIEAFVNSTVPGTRQITLSYLTTGLGWQAEYRLLYGGSNSAELTGWVNLNNQSGTSFPEADVVLIAGGVNRDTSSIASLAGDTEQDQAYKPRKSTLEPLVDYVRYKLPFQTSLDEMESKQALFIEPYTIEVDHYYKYKWMETKSDVKSLISFNNDKSSGPGVPLPAGRIGIFDNDSGAFLGSARLKATPVDEKSDIVLGTAFDITAERKRIDHRKIARDKNSDSFEIKLRNHMAEKVKVVVAEELYGYWDIIEKSDDFIKKDFQNIEFEVWIDPGQEKIITYTVEYSY